MAKRFDFEVWHDGMRVAGGEAPSEDEAKREAMHYAAMYAQDGGHVVARFGRHPLPNDKAWREARREPGA